MSSSKTTEIITATSGEGLSLTSNSEFMFSELTPAYEYNLINFGLGSNRCVDDKGNIICSLYEFNVKNIDGKKFIGWYHTGENTLHQIGEK